VAGKTESASLVCGGDETEDEVLFGFDLFQADEVVEVALGTDEN
jgi:hypothetical protein